MSKYLQNYTELNRKIQKNTVNYNKEKPRYNHVKGDYTGGFKSFIKTYKNADCRTQTGDPLITSEVLYQLS